MSHKNSGPNPIDSEVMHKVVNHPDLGHMPASEIALIALIAIGEYKEYVWGLRDKQVQSSGFEKDM